MPTFRTDLHSGHKVPLVEADDIRNGALKAENFSDGAVTTEKLADGAVTTPKINNGAITEGKLANGSITTVKIQNNAVTEYKIGEGAVTEGKIASNAVTEDKIGNGAVTKDKIANNAVTTDKILNGAVTTEKLAPQAIQQITDLEAQFQGNETTRQQNEAQRISNEESRVTEFDRLKSESETATADANAAATLANAKAALAADKAALADNAATLANEKAQLAADKAALADDAATLANDKAALAQQKAEYAQTQGDYAKAQGNYAKEQGEIAEEDHTRAEADHTRAESDHATAGSDHTTATTDHSTAANDHTTASEDHNTATSDHTRAESDHTNIINAIASADLVFDISLAHASEGALAQYADLAAALGADGVNVPSENRHGGMTVKYVQSSDSKYVRYNLLADSFTTNTAQWAIDDAGVYVENPEYIKVVTDNEGKILWAIKTDGSIYYGAGIPQQVNTALGNKADKVAGKGLIQTDVADSLSVIEDLGDRIEIKTDSEQRIISYRDKQGVLHENAGLVLSESAMNSFKNALLEAGIQSGGMDFSDKEVIELPEPIHCALLNIHVTALPVISNIYGDNSAEGFAEYYDKSGNYFKLNCKLTIQGQTSRNFAANWGKANYTFDIEKDVKFGDWVPQDSFHLKGCAKDVVRGMLPTSYKWAYKFMEYLDAKPNRVLVDESNITTTQASGTRINDWPSDARCLPDGFPVEIYVNDEYWGLYSWQLKKHRKNYSMDKNDYTSFFLDAEGMMSDDYSTGIWNEGPKRWWNAFEIKNPKSLILMNGSDYGEKGEPISPLISTFDSTNWAYTNEYSVEEPISDIWNGSSTYNIDDVCWCYDEEIEWWRKFKSLTDSNINHKPLTFTENTVYNANNTKHRGSYTTKTIIQSFAKKYLEVKALIGAGDTTNAKEKFNEYFDYNACMLVFIYNSLMNNGDSIKKNTLWATYKNGKIAPMLWDLDGVYGTGWQGLSANAPSVGTWNSYANANWPLSLFWTLYESEIKSVYANLRNNGIISIPTWNSIVFGEWVNRIGEEAYKRDINKWPETPSYRANNINSTYWESVSYDSSVAAWDEATEYEAGDKANLTNPITFSTITFKARTANSNQRPLTVFYSRFPETGGFFDSPKRWKKWITQQISLCDSFMEYTSQL